MLKGKLICCILTKLCYKMRGGGAVLPRRPAFIERSAIFLNRTYIFLLYIKVNWLVKQTGVVLICFRRQSARKGGQAAERVIAPRICSGQDNM